LSRVRAQTRTLLIDAVLTLFSGKSMRVPAIHEIATQAGVATGTFYNYFRTCEELLEAAVVERFARVQDQIGRMHTLIADPAERTSIGIRSVLLQAEREPMWAAGVLRLWNSAPDTLISMLTLAVGDLRAGRRSGRFTFRREREAIDLLVGTAAAGMRRVIDEGHGAEHGAAMAALILRGLGIPGAEADAIVRRPLPPRVDAGNRRVDSNVRRG
jgi:AcrR family transcriptional regulator